MKIFISPCIINFSYTCHLNFFDANFMPLSLMLSYLKQLRVSTRFNQEPHPIKSAKQKRKLVIQDDPD